jgi:hypothetical protein
VIVSHCHIHVIEENISKLSLYIVDLNEEGVLKSEVGETTPYFSRAPGKRNYILREWWLSE